MFCKKFIFGFLIPVLCAVANSASACSVCFSAKKGTLAAYHGTTILLTLLPFVVIGTGILLIRRKLQNTQ